MSKRRMTWSEIWRWLGLGASLVLAACVSKLPLDNSPCPCPTAGFVCCDNGAAAHCVHSLGGETADQTCSRSNVDAGGMGGHVDAGGTGGDEPVNGDALMIGTAIRPVQGISIGRAHACVSYGEYRVASMGDNSKGQAAPPPGFLSGLTAGDDFTCAAKRDAVDPAKDGLVVCWGDNTYGQATPPPGTKWVIAGGRLACGGGDNGPTVCWGDNSAGQATFPPGVSTGRRAGTPPQLHLCLRGDRRVPSQGHHPLLGRQLARANQRTDRDPLRRPRGVPGCRRRGVRPSA